MAEKFVDTPAAGAAGWRELWVENRRYRPLQNRFLDRLIRRFVRPTIEAEEERQRDYNLALLELIADLKRELDDVRAGFRVDIEAVQRDVRAADDVLAVDLAATAARIPIATLRNDALIAALDQKIETIAVRLRDATSSMLGPAATARGDQTPQISHPEDFIYRRLEDALRGSEDEVRASVAPYVALATENAPLFDAGCGRGELLLACRDAGVVARGCDTNERSVADLRARGIDVAVDSIPACLDSVGDGMLGSVAALHVVEHIPVDALFGLFAAAARTLRRGGLLMIETPNAESLVMSGSQFWRDPTHLAPRHPAALVVLGREHGFDVAEARAVHDFPPGTEIATREDDGPDVVRLIAAINERLFAPQDFRLILRKR